MDSATKKLLESEKKAIAQTIGEMNDIETIHKIWCLCNRYNVKRSKAAKKSA